jgi:hypothetical protein
LEDEHVGWLSKGPGYTVADLVYWSGFIGGALIGYAVLFHAFEVHRLVQLLGMLACGVACGFLCETLYRRLRKGPRNGDDSGPRPPP